MLLAGLVLCSMEGKVLLLVLTILSSLLLRSQSSRKEESSPIPKI